MQKQLVFGAGLIGGYLSAMLARQGYKPLLVARPRIVENLKSGLRVTDFEGHDHVVEALDMVSEDAAGEAMEVVWLTVKCTAIEQALDAMSRWVGPETMILCCQNGLGSDAMVRQRFPDNVVRRVMVPFNVVTLTPAHYHRGSEGTLSVEVQEGADEALRALVDQLNNPMMPVAVTTQMTALQWAKLQLNLGNAVNALLNVPVKQMLESRDARRVIARLMDELLAVCRANHMSLPKVARLPGTWLPWVLRLPDWLFRRVANSMLSIDPTVRTSMWWDLDASRPTEIDYLNGAVVEAAQRAGIDCRANQHIVALIKEVESTQREGKPRCDLSATQLWSIING
ncbi:2-dehydropantoate 2-reductase [Aestuariibacter halophilus]|uniref:2-dehydropantoate 2-reductase n=1 Tax=Fluctibacter halophilus TaxID=226011 RepID=A0ABS8G7R7_9ALTE|nr:2-dehydropantoate 2-reductase [Aestuariibacter halophilus]MCC2615855.1 2-dehydropantoate 2-reductase [Aestuariibacter halophilus]